MFGFRLLLAPLFALVSVALAAGIVWLAYFEAGVMTSQRQPPLVKASTAPLKRSPADPGGRAVADYGGVGELLSEQTEEAEERLLPKAEQPVTPDATESGSNGTEALAALEALVSEIRTDRPGGDDLSEDGVASEPVTPEPVAPEPTTPDPATLPETAGLPEADGGQLDETDVTVLTEAFRGDAAGRYRVQLAAVREEEDAQRAWIVFQQRLGSLVDGLQPFFERAETNNGTFYRVQVGPFGETTEADRMCAELQKQSTSCFVVTR